MCFRDVNEKDRPMTKYAAAESHGDA